MYAKKLVLKCLSICLNTTLKVESLPSSIFIISEFDMFGFIRRYTAQPVLLVVIKKSGVNGPFSVIHLFP